MNSYSKEDDVIDVTGIHSTDRILFIGENPTFFMDKYAREFIYAESPNDVGFADVFNKICVRLDPELLTRELVGALCCINIGLLVFFIEDDLHRARVQEMLDTLWYPSCSWDFVSNEGKCLVSNAYGPQLKEAGDINIDIFD